MYDSLSPSLTDRSQPETHKPKRATLPQRERDQDATALRKAVERSDPKAISDSNRLPDRDRSERRYFIFYQDEGGFRATSEANEPLDTIYYLGIIDILTPFGVSKWFENFFKGFVHDKVRLPNRSTLLSVLTIVVYSTPSHRCRH